MGKIWISTGQEFDRFDMDGKLIPLTVDEMAASARMMSNGKIMCPQVTWVKDFPDQVTEGRIGRPTHAWATIDWLPSAEAEVIRQAMRDRTA
jgi:hypothetical protein